MRNGAEKKASKLVRRKVGKKAEMKAKIAVAKSSLKAGMPVDVIAEITCLSVDQIKQLQKENTF